MTVEHTDPGTLARSVETAVLAVPGVTAVFPVRPSIASVGDAVRGAIDTRSLEAPRVAVEPDGVRVAIGTDERHDAREVVHAVRRSLVTVLRAAGHPTDRVVVRVARIS